MIRILAAALAPALLIDGAIAAQPPPTVRPGPSQVDGGTLRVFPTAPESPPASPIPGTPVWAIAGANCVPTGQSSNAHVVFNSAGDAKFADASVGELILTCLVPSSGGSARALTITYLRTVHPTASGTTISAALRRKNLSTGAVSTVAEIANAGAGRTPQGYQTESVVFATCPGAALSLSGDAFYVQVNITRRASPFGAPLDQPALAGITLSTISC